MEHEGNGASIRITARDIYDKVIELGRRMDLAAGMAAQVADHETRLRKLETKFVGIAASAVGLVITALAVIVWKVIGA